MPPTIAIQTVAAKTSQSDGPSAPVTPNRSQAIMTPIVAAITASPPPCGVGTLCDERAVGCASAWRISKGCNSRINRVQINAEAANTSASHPADIMSQPPQCNAVGNAAAVETRLDVDDDALAVAQQRHD